MNLESIRYGYLRRIVVPVLRGMGVRVSTALAGRLARGVFEMNTPGRRRAEARLRAALGERGGADGERMIEATYQHLARFWTEALFIPRRLRENSWRRYVRIENESGLRALADSGRGCVLATAYFGNMAAAACALGQIFRPVHVIVDWLAHPALAAWQRELYAQRWVRPIARGEAAASIPRVLSAGGAVFMVCEHERRGRGGVRTRFLGRELSCAPTLGRLARWFDVPVGVVTCRREAALFSFTLALHEVLEHDPGATDDGDLVRRAMGTLEDAVMRAPEQYLWSTPAGEETRGRSAGSGERRVGRYWKGKRIGMVPKRTSKSVGVAMDVSGGHRAG